MSHKHILAALALGLALASPAVRAATPTVAERSPFAQGFWWDPARAGSGFEMFSAGGNVMVVWYTYEESGRAVWYTAQGNAASLGREAWPLLRHKWSAGRHAEPVTVGSLKLTPTTAETAQLEWRIGTASGTAAIVPFIQSGIVNEADRSGTWFDPGNTGWGLSLLEQGEVSGAALFTYDAAGEPTWAAGFERARGSVEVFTSAGACPACPYRAPALVSAGRVGLDFAGENALTLRMANVRLAMAPGVNADGARMTQLSRPASTRAADRQLARFDAASLKAYLDEGLLAVPVYGPPADFSASPAIAPTAFSGTNLQEAGVDEAGLVKSNGRYVYTYAYDTSGYNRIPQIRALRVDAEGAAANAAGTVPVGVGNTPVATAGLLIHGDKLVSVHGSQAYAYAYAAWAPGTQWTNGLTQVEIFDISGGVPVTRWRADIDGYIVATRRIGPTLYVVSRFTPYVGGFQYGYGTQVPAIAAANRELLAQGSLQQLLPKYRTTRGEDGVLVTPAEVYAPPQGSRRALADLVLVTAIDIDGERIRQSLAVVGSVEAVYASPDNLYFASSRQDVRDRTGQLLPETSLFRTDVHQVALRDGALAVVGSGAIEGYLDGNLDKAPFRLSESQGKLRAVTTSRTNLWSATGRNRVTILEPSAVAPGVLRTVAFLPNANRPEALGKPLETLHATRFVGDRLYAVTFRQVDPLYVVDLSQPADPRIAGALEIPGFSEYLHPLPNGLLLGFGKDAKPSGIDFGDGGTAAWYQGLQMALYDVRNAGRPVEMQRVIVGKRGSESALLQHHHAFSALQAAPDRLQIAVPARVADGGLPMYGFGDSAFYPWLYSGLLRFELTGTTAADARLTLQAPLVAGGSANGLNPNGDAAASGGRSVLFPRGALYVGNGRFWHLSTSGTVTGPF